MIFSTQGFASAGPMIQFKSSSEAGNIFKYNNEDTHKPGICVELADLFQKQFKIPIKGFDEYKTIAKIIMDLRSDRMDIFFCLIKDSVRMTAMDFIEPPLFSENVVLLQRADDPAKVHSWDDIRKLSGNNTVLVVNESVYKDLVAAQTGLVIDDGGRDLRLNIKKLLSRRGRFLVASEPALLREIEQGGLQKQLKIQDWVIRSETQYLTVRKNLPPDIKLQLSHQIEEMRKSDDYKRILHKYRVSP